MLILVAEVRVVSVGSGPEESKWLKSQLRLGNVINNSGEFMGDLREFLVCLMYLCVLLVDYR